MKENSAYIKGRLDGVNLDRTTAEGKLIAALCDIIDKMAEEIDSLSEKIETANAYIEEIDEDLGCVEEIVYEDIDGDGCDCCCDDEDDDDCCCDCDCCDDDDDDGFLCVMCPNCGDTIYIEDTVDPDEVICPSCQKPIVSEEDETENV